MRIAYARPAPGERYLVEKKVARRIVAASPVPELEVVAFQTRHGPNMTRGLRYCALYSQRSLCVLSVEEALISEPLAETFATVVLPWICERIAGFKVRGASWPCVVVVLDGDFVEVACSAGGLFPSAEEIGARPRRGRTRIACVAPIASASTARPSGRSRR